MPAADESTIGLPRCKLGQEVVGEACEEGGLLTARNAEVALVVVP